MCWSTTCINTTIYIFCVKFTDHYHSFTELFLKMNCLFYQQRFKKDVDSYFGKDGEKILDMTLSVSEKLKNQFPSLIINIFWATDCYLKSSKWLITHVPLRTTLVSSI